MVKRKITVELDKTDEVIERVAKNFGGNASHVILPAKHRGKEVLIICPSKYKKRKDGRKWKK